MSVYIPVLRLSRRRKKVLFYCHFPDQLLTQRQSALKRLYRAPIDWMEERTTGMADMVGRYRDRMLTRKPLDNCLLFSSEAIAKGG